MWHGVPCPRSMPLQPHVLRTSRPYPEGRQRTPNFTLPRGPFGILANLGIGGASLGHPSHLQRGLCAGSSSSRRPKGQADRALRQGPPREHQSTQEVSTPTDVGGLAHSDENRSSRHLSSTPESFVTFLALEGGPISQERPRSNPNTEHPGESIHVFPSTLQPIGQAPHASAEEASTMLPTSNHYWRLLNDPRLAPLDPGLSPITRGLGPPVVMTEAFLGLTQQVRTLTGMIQAIVPYIPQLA
ncbi:hypothetical protein GW17_00018800 [Ensete ventricosum]|nr:hypothetical protein GW17_00018800 [Ensete ventricosum]